MEEFFDNLSPEDLDDLSSTIVLTDQDGNDTEFELMDIISYKDEDYAILLPADDENESELVILQMEDEDEDDDEVSFLPVESEETLSAIYEIFKEKFKDEFDFVD